MLEILTAPRDTVKMSCCVHPHSRNLAYIGLGIGCVEIIQAGIKSKS